MNSAKNLLPVANQYWPNEFCLTGIDRLVWASADLTLPFGRHL